MNRVVYDKNTAPKNPVSLLLVNLIWEFFLVCPPLNEMPASHKFLWKQIFISVSLTKPTVSENGDS